MNTMQLACFLAVAETLNFARAAERLHVTQPAVTQQIRSLETELNVKLFRRTTRTVVLTQAGLVFLGDAKAMLEISERAKKQAEHAVADTREPFVIGCHVHSEVFHLTGPLQEMRERFPSFYPIFQIVPFQHLYQRLIEETVDVVVSFREGGLKEAIHYRELMQIRATGIMQVTHPLAQAGELHVCDLRQAPIIILNPQKCPEEYRSLMHHILEDRSPGEVYFCDSVEVSVTLAQAGYGVAIVPDLFYHQDERFAHLPIVDAAPLSYGVYYQSLAGHPLRKAFVEAASKHFFQQA